MTCDVCLQENLGLEWLTNAGGRLAVCQDCLEALKKPTPTFKNQFEGGRVSDSTRSFENSDCRYEHLQLSAILTPIEKPRNR